MTVRGTGAVLAPGTRGAGAGVTGHGSVALAALLASVALVAPAGAQSLADLGVPDTPGGPARRPNILYVFSDDHAPHAIGAYGTRFAGLEPAVTPTIDRLAAEGMLFRNSFCTNAICGPSRAVVLTGKHSHVNGFRDNGDRFDGDQVTFPKLLRAAGYATAILGKWHLGSDPQGFDHWEVLPGQGDYYNPVLSSAAGTRTVEGYCTDIVTDLALEWLERQRAADPDRPWLLMCQHKAPHRNWMPPERYLDLWDDVLLPEPETLFDDHADDAPSARAAEMGVDAHMNLVYDLFLEPFEGWDPSAGTANDSSGFRNLERMTPAQRAAWDAAFADENAAFLEEYLAGELSPEDVVRWKYQRYLKNYLRTARTVDDSIARLLAYLDEHDLAENTIVVYSSDQGFFLGDHGWFDKRWMYEESLRMPLIVRWPGVTAPGSTDAHLVQNLDHAPTLLEAAGVPLPADLQGASLLPLLRGEPAPAWRDAIYYHYYAFPSIHQVSRQYGIRTERWKLIHLYSFDAWELYDLESDPDERTNLFGQPDHLLTTVRLAQRLGELRTRFVNNNAD